MNEEKTIVVTDIEDFDEVDIIEILVSPGDVVEANQSIVTLESDKAMMEFPSSYAGVVKRVNVSVGDKVKQGDELIVIEMGETTNSEDKVATSEVEAITKEQSIEENVNKKQQTKNKKNNINPDKAYASPAVRKYATELGLDLDKVTGSAEHGRILKQDVQSYIQKRISTVGIGIANPQYILPDFSEFGEIEEKPLNKLRQVSAKHLQHAWEVAPHVTQFDNADITETELARNQLKEKMQSQEIKLTLLPFIMKALVKCLQEYSDFNSSINSEVTSLIHKKYYHLGIAVDTPRGLVVPVIRDVDQKKITEIAKELAEVSSLAREGKLTPRQMQGGCMTITSLGGIGGSHFTPIINFPEVAILGVSRSYTKLVINNDEIEERLMLPLSLTYDHRAIDGVAGVNFITSLKNKLSDVWSLMI
ncbi:MAG: 2-oxo acid dehydrogenase subunit E2 [Gammaproteobacteria bacterium]|nr:2-oxo acid dehydrogenase subunit E2 [Gammaproteobacteria bacterium]